jgi:hypothetical protein
VKILKYIFPERKNYYLNQLILGNENIFFFLENIDLRSYYNWENQTCCSNNTLNFQLITNHLDGLLFKSKRDRKIIIVDPKAIGGFGDNTIRKEIQSDKYTQVVVYRHLTRRKT